MEKPDFNELFESVISYPDFKYQERLNFLIGLDDYKLRLEKLISILINSNGIDKWIKKYHKGANKIISYVLNRPPLIVLEGDVGSENRISNYDR